MPAHGTTKVKSYLVMTPVLAMEPSQFNDGFGWRSKVSLS